MEKQIKLKTDDGYVIYGVLSSGTRASDHLIVFVHGLTGHKNEHIFYNAARFFPKKGFDVFRFDLYSGEKGGRSLVDCNIRTHASDLNVVLKNFGKKYIHISVVGHSLGGPTVVCADTSLMQSIVLWEPSNMRGLDEIEEDLERPLRFVKELDAHVFEWGVSFLLGSKMAKDFGTLKPEQYMKKINKPVKIICAEDGNVKGGKKYLQHAHDPKDLTVIPKAGHAFDEEDAEGELFDQTLKWLEKYT